MDARDKWHSARTEAQLSHQESAPFTVRIASYVHEFTNRTVSTSQVTICIEDKFGEANKSHRYYTWYDVSMKAVRIDYGYRAVYRLFYHIEEDKQKEILSRPAPSSLLE